MNPHKMNKVDVSSMSEQDQKAFKLYGKLPAKTPLTMMQKDRKYFDSGDYAMSQAGKKSDAVPGREIPTPENVPHAALPSRHNSVTGHAFSPTGSPPAASPAHEYAQFGQLDRMPSHEQKNHVGVGISPDSTTEPVEMPMPTAARHGRRLSESHARISPPATMREMREGASPVSSFPIERHNAHLGSSPVKSSTLAKRVDEEA